MNYNLPDHISGDTFFGVQFTVSNQDGPLNLSGASIVLQTSQTQSLSTEGEEIEINGSGVFTIKEQIIDWPARVYPYRITITFADTMVRTYITGKWKISDGVS